MASNCSPLVPHLLRGDSQMEHQFNMPLPCAQKQWAHFLHGMQSMHLKVYSLSQFRTESAKLANVSCV